MIIYFYFLVFLVRLKISFYLENFLKRLFKVVRAIMTTQISEVVMSFEYRNLLYRISSFILVEFL